MTKDKIIEIIDDDELTDSTLFLDGLDDAIIGYTYNQNGKVVIVYDRSLILNLLIQKEGMCYEEANEYLEFNIEGAYVGECTPIIIEHIA